MKKIFLCFLVSMFFGIAQAESATLSIPMTMNNWNVGVHTSSINYKGIAPWVDVIADGIKTGGYDKRGGVYLYSQDKFDLRNSTIYTKWKANGAGTFMTFHSGAGNYIGGSLAGLSGSIFTTDHSYSGSTVINDDQWYYSMLAINPDANYQAVTTTGNYFDQGGSLLFSRSGSIPSANFSQLNNASVYFALGDNYGAPNSYLVGGEAIVKYTPVPEPSSILLGFLGLSGVLGFRKMNK